MKKLFVIFLVVLVSVGLFADKKAEKSIFDVNPDRNQTTSNSMSRDLFDLQFQIDVSDVIAEGIAGVEYDGEYFYAAEWGYSGTDIHILDIDGNEVGSFTPPVTGTGIRDMAWDGTYLYGSNASNAIYCFDTAGTLITTIPTPGAVRSIAYDSDLDGFWYNNFDSDLHFVDRSGTLMNTITAPPSMYGCAYDNYSLGGPFLWFFTGTSTGAGCQVEQYDLAAGTLTGVTHSVEADGIAGGLFIADGIVAGKATIGALAQGTFIYGYELCDTAPLVSPGAPTGVTVTPDAGGALTADIDWTCPTLDVGGSTLTDLDEMRVYRDGVLIYTDSAPVIGDPGSYADAVTASGSYAYSVVGFNDAGEGIPVAISSWVGEDVPNMVTDLLLADVNLDGYLTWTNPTTGLNGGAFNEAILGYHILRSDAVMLEVTGLVTEYTDDTIPFDNTYSYSVQTYNSVGDGGIAISNEVWIGNSPQYCDSFWTNTTDDWITNVMFNTIDNTSAQGGPQSYEDFTAITTDVIAGETYTFSMTWESTTWTEKGAVWFDWNQNGTFFDAGEYYEVGEGASVTVTLDILIPVDAAAGATRMRVSERFNNYPEPCNESASVYGETEDYTVVIGGGSTPGSIEGNVTLVDGMGDVEDVVVTAGGNTLNPDDMGDYSISLFEGTYDVTASLAGYESMTIEDVIVTEGNATTGVDFTLTYIPITFEPIENLTVDDMTGLLSWDPPGGAVEYFELIQHDGNNVNGYFEVFDNGYGVVYDVSGYTNVTVEMLDFRHSSWGLIGTWDYALHIVDWDTHTEIAVVTGLQTTVNDDWELEVDLGSVSASGLVGIFMEPQGNTAADAYPDLDSDDVGPDGMSYWGPLADYSGMALSDIGDFLMDLWIMGSETDGVVQAKKFPANFGNGNARIANTIPTFDFITLNQTAYSRDLTGYNVYLGGIPQGNTTDTQYQLTGLTIGTVYTAGVEAVYDDGVSNTIEITFTYDPSEAGNVIVAATKLGNNYPNPFNPVTNIAYSIKETGNVTLEVYNMRGQLVKTLVNEVKETGDHTAVWNGTDNSNKSASSGVYFYKMVSESNIGRYTSTKKMILMK